MSFLGVHSLVLLLICLSSPSLCLLFLNHSQTLKPSVLFRDSETHLTDFQVVCVCLRHLCFFHLLKCKCAYKTWKPPKKTYLLHLIMKRIIFRVRDQQVGVSTCVLCIAFLSCSGCRDENSAALCSCRFRSLFFNGHSCCASSC